MRDDPKVWLEDILQSIEVIESYLSAISQDEFLNSPELQDKVIRRFVIIGEAVNNLTPEFRARHPEVAWDNAYSMRNLLVHEYFDVDYDIVWNTAHAGLPEMKKQIKGILKLIE